MFIIAKSDLFPSLSDITFADKDPDTITREIISLYEQSAGRTLARADPVRLFIDAIILAVIQQHNIIDHSAKMNLLAYASGSYLDHLGALLGVFRLQAAAARCTLRFTLTEPRSYNSVIPKGTRAGAGVITFATDSEAVIKAGSLYADTAASCTAGGSAGNDFLPGQVNKLVDVLPFPVGVGNITASGGGNDTETDEAFRERIHLAPESFSVAGPVKAYEFFAKSANSGISSVAVAGPPDTQPGHVHIYPLMYGGELPGPEVLAQVYAACNADDVRPDTDYLSVLSPERVSYALDVSFWINEGDSSGAGLIREECVKACDAWVKWQDEHLGRDINPSELVYRLVQAGAKRCVVRSPVFRELKAWEVGKCSGVNVVYEGLEKE